MKICFVQPETDYQIEINRYALAVTFPQLISDLNLENTDYCVYIFGKAKCDFENFLVKNRPTHVFITAITSTFPYAEEIAGICQAHGCTVVLGGLFASISYPEILENFPVFDFVISGKPDKTVLSLIEKKPTSPVHLAFKGVSDYSKRLGDIITDERFLGYYTDEDTVCYELTNGCHYNCSFCTMRRAFPDSRPCPRPLDVARDDLETLSRHFHKLKLIDDDIHNSLDMLRELDLSAFDEVIAETRLDKLSESSARVLHEAGITHLIVGVESLDPAFLKHSNKAAARGWRKRAEAAIELCKKYHIQLRPVVMITNECTTIESLEALEGFLVGWTPENNVELLCSFYTPHPGVGSAEDYRGLVTTDLRYFDHLHIVWVPPMIGRENMDRLIESYGKIVALTDSHKFNPVLEVPTEMPDKYSCFFKK